MKLDHIFRCFWFGCLSRQFFVRDFERIQAFDDRGWCRSRSFAVNRASACGAKLKAVTSRWPLGIKDGALFHFKVGADH